MLYAELASSIIEATHGPVIPFKTIKDGLATGDLQIGTDVIIAKGVMIKGLIETGQESRQGLAKSYIPHESTKVLDGKYVGDTYDDQGERNGILVENERGARYPVSLNCGAVDKWSIELKFTYYGTLTFPYTKTFLDSARKVLTSWDKAKKGLYKESLEKLNRLKVGIETIAKPTATKIAETLFYGISQLGVVTSVYNVLYNTQLYKLFEKVTDDTKVNDELWCFTTYRFGEVIENRETKDRENISFTTNTGDYIVIPNGNSDPIIFRVGIPRGSHICLEEYEVKATPGDFGIRTISLSETTNTIYVDNGAFSGYIYSPAKLEALIRSINHSTITEVMHTSTLLIDSLMHKLKERIEE